MGDIFRIQDEIAAAVVAALKATMATMPSNSGARSANIDSYNEVLRGRYFWRLSTREDSDRALSAFQQAVQFDLMNADAWVGKAATYNERGESGWMRPQDAYAEARQAIERALTINPTWPART
jgi:tetratricopeptide (TPR) repeat protein